MKNLFRWLISSEKIRLSILLLFLLALFFWKIVFLGRCLVPADLLFQYYPWAGQVPPSFTHPSNSLLSDQILQFYPWISFAVGSIKSGILPLWNPYSAGGSPFVANYQSAVFFPLKLLFYLWPVKFAFGPFAMIKLFIAGFFAYLFAKEISIGKFGALITAVVFMFSGFLIVWLGHPLTNVAIWLPLLFLLIEKLIKKKGEGRRDEGGGKIGYIAILALVSGVQFLGGHIETSFHIMVILGFYGLFRIFSEYRGGGKVKEIAGVFSAVLLSFFIGILLAAIQIVPFLEYLKLSWSLAARSQLVTNPYFLPKKAMLTFLVPNFFGNPIANNFWGTGQNMNYSEITGYLGILPLLLAIVALLFEFKDKRVIFFLLLSSFGLAMAYGVFPIFQLVTWFPGFRISANSRLLLMSTFSISVLAGFGADFLINRSSQKQRRLIPFLLGSLSGLAGLVIILSIRNNIALGYLRQPVTKYVWQNIFLFIFLLVLGIVLLAFWCWGWMNIKIFQPLVIGLIVLDLFVLGSFYNPAIEAKDIFPETNLIRFLKKDRSLFRVISLGDTLLINTGMVYGLSDPRTFDALTQRRLQKLFNETKGFFGNFQMTRAWQPELFNLLNIKYLVTEPGWGTANGSIDIAQNKANATFGEIFGAGTQGQTFVSRQPNLTRIDVNLATYNRVNHHPLIFHLRASPDSTTDLVRLTVNSAKIRDNSFQIFEFPPIKDSKGRAFYFFLESPQSRPGDAVTVWASLKERYRAGQRYLNGIPTYGDLTFETFYANPRGKLALVYQGKDGRVYQNGDYLPRAYVVPQATVLRDERQILRTLRSPLFDLRKSVILEEEFSENKKFSKSESKEYSSKVNVVKYKPNLVSVRAKTKSSGFLVLSDAYYPGWQAEVDGKLSNIYRANYLWRAVYLPPGEHIVNFVYRPLSFKLGLFLSSFGLLVVAILGVGWGIKFFI